MIKLSDFARAQGVTNRAVQLALKRHEADLEGHFERKGQNGTWLDDYAEEYLRSRMLQKPVVVYDSSMSPLLEENQRLRAEKEDLQKALSVAYERLADVLEQSNTAQIQLQVERAEKRMISAGKEEAERKVESLEMKASEAERLAISARREKVEVEIALTAAEEENKTLADVAEANAQEAERAKKAAEALQAELDRRQAELDELKGRGFFARLFNRGVK